jgi:hypothetical protein
MTQHLATYDLEQPGEIFIYELPIHFQPYRLVLQEICLAKK